MKQAMLKRTLSLLLTAAILLTAAGCSKVPRADSSIKMTGMYFDTVISVEVWGTTIMHTGALQRNVYPLRKPFQPNH